MNDDFALRYVRIYPGVNNREELVTLAQGLRLERRFAPLTQGTTARKDKNILLGDSSKIRY